MLGKISLNAYTNSNDAIWEKLQEELIKIYQCKIQLFSPLKWNREYYSWYKQIEHFCFRSELQYSFEEVAIRWDEPERLFIFVLKEDKDKSMVPEAFWLGYKTDNTEEKVFYLDTIAIITQGRGIGRIILEMIILWAKSHEFQSLLVNTEYENEKGLPLVHFYQKHGF